MSSRRLWLLIAATPPAVTAAAVWPAIPGLLIASAVIAAAAMKLRSRSGTAAAMMIGASAWAASIGPWSGALRLWCAVAAAGAVASGRALQRFDARAPAVAALIVVLAAFAADREAPTIGTLPSQERLRAVDRYLHDQVNGARIPGVAAAIVTDSRVVFSRAYGRATPGRPMTPDTQVVLGSTSKSMTAAATLQLVDDGLIDLDATVGSYLAWFKPADRRARRISVRHLLIDTSGIPTWAGWGTLGGNGRAEPAKIRTLLNHIRLTSTPGERFQYSNANYIVLGQIIEAVTDRSFAATLQQRVFDPLRMRHSTAGDAEHTAANRYWFGTPVPSHLPYLAIGLPAGAITSSADDLAQYLRMQLGASEGVLSEASRRGSHRPAVVAAGFGVPPGRHYAMGWYTGSVAGERAVFHAGDILDSSSALVMFPGRHTGIAVVATTSNAVTPIAKTLADGVAGILVGGARPGLTGALAIGSVAPGALGGAALAFAALRWSALVVRRRRVDTFRAVARVVAIDTVIPLFVLLGLPVLFSRLLDRAESVGMANFWRLALRAAPDVGVLLLAALALRLMAVTVLCVRRVTDAAALGAAHYSAPMPVYSFGDLTPQIHPDAWVAENATIIGSVVLEAGASVWYGCVLRSEFATITLGEGSNVQDLTVMHTDPGVPLTVGKGVTIGHAAMIHGAILEDGCLIGLHATVLNGAVIGARSLIAAGALVKEGQHIPPGVLAAGVPAKVVRELDATATQGLVRSAEHYVENAKNHATKRTLLT